MSPDAAEPDIRLRTVVVAFGACVLPFLGKPFHIDDPMYIWAAQHISAHPMDFYGFPVNWHGTVTPMTQVMKNPPLVSYFLAAAAQALGWSEVALHAALLLPAVALVVGTYQLAQLLTARPGEATLVAVLTPVLLVSTTTVMSDVPMLCAWVWSILCWMRGIRGRSPAFLALGALLVAVAALTKYFGIALLPLLAGYAFMRDRQVWRWASWLLLPVAILAAYQIATQQLYGRGLLLDAMTYASAVRAKNQWETLPRLLTSLAFTGGCLATILWYGPSLWSRRTLVVWVAGLLGMAALLAWMGKLGPHPLRDEAGVRWAAVAQLALAVMVGMSVVTLAALDLVSEWSPEGALLAAWTVGTLAFAFGLNWTVNARAMLPLAPVVGILVARRLDRRRASRDIGSRQTRWALIPAAALALLVAAADYGLALASREGAQRLGVELSGRGSTVWFQGHWGFQYYAERAGFRPLDFRHPAVEPGDLVIKPTSISNPIELPRGTVVLVRQFDLRSFPILSTMSLPMGAGFYAGVWGPLPFVFGNVPPEHYRVFEAVVPIRE